MKKIITLSLALSLLAPSIALAQTKPLCAAVFTAAAVDGVNAWNAHKDTRPAYYHPVTMDAIDSSKPFFVSLNVLLATPACIAISQQDKKKNKWVIAVAVTGLYSFLAYKSAKSK